MSALSELHDAGSWPCGREHWIEDWADGRRALPGALDSADVREDLARLAALRAKTGGWLVYDEGAGCVRFVPLPEWWDVRGRREGDPAPGRCRS